MLGSMVLLQLGGKLMSMNHGRLWSVLPPKVMLMFMGQAATEEGLYWCPRPVLPPETMMKPVAHADAVARQMSVVCAVTSASSQSVLLLTVRTRKLFWQ